MTAIEMDWKGKSGNAYRYQGYPIGTSVNEVPANYIFAKSENPGFWTAVYIGETENLKERFASHHKEDCILKNGGTHFFVHKSSADHQVRLDEETDLRGRYNTSCNDQ